MKYKYQIGVNDMGGYGIAEYVAKAFDGAGLVYERPTQNVFNLLADTAELGMWTNVAMNRWASANNIDFTCNQGVSDGHICWRIRARYNKQLCAWVKMRRMD